MSCPAIHRSTVVVALGMAVLFAVLNVPGELILPPGGIVAPNTAGTFSGIAPIAYTAEYVHGWPWLSLYRIVDYNPQMPNMGTRPTPTHGVPWLTWTSWKFWQGRTWELRPTALAADVAVSLLLIVVVASAWEWRRRCRTRWLQFTLREIAIATVVVATAFGWWRYALVQYAREEVALDGPESEHFRTAGFAYHGPLFLKRFVGEHLLWPVFIRNDGIWMEVIDASQFRDTLNAIRGFSYLRELELKNNLQDAKVKIPFSELAKFKGLRQLTLDDFVISESDVAELAALRQLDEICLRGWAYIEPEEIQRLRDALPNCRIVEDPSEYIEEYGWQTELGSP